MNYEEEVQKQGFKKKFENKKGDNTKSSKKPAKEKTWDEMTSLEKHRALKNN